MGGDPAAPAGDDGWSGPRRGLVIAAIIAAMVLIIGSVGFVVTRDDDADTDDDVASRDDDEDESSPSTTEAEPDPGPSSTEPDTAPTTTAPPIDDAEFLAIVRELQTYVEQARGLEFDDDVVVDLQEDDEFEAGLLEDFEEDAEEFADAEVLYRSLGLIQTEETLEEILRAVYAGAVLGYYDTETNELVVRGASATPYVQQTIVHELVHALDDQRFELYRPDYQDRNDELSTGFSAVVEGNARRVESDWLDDQPADVQDQAAAEEQAFGADLDFDDIPPIVLFEIGAPYQFGEIFVNDIVAESGERAVDEALRAPPETSEQFLYPDVYRNREGRVDVPAPPADGDIVDEGALGALFLYGLLTDPVAGVSPSDAARAIDGWGGDWFVTWRTEDDLNCVRADIVGDTANDTDELRFALETWVDTGGLGSISEVDGRVRLESCATGGGASRNV